MDHVLALEITRIGVLALSGENRDALTFLDDFFRFRKNHSTTLFGNCLSNATTVLQDAVRGIDDAVSFFSGDITSDHRNFDAFVHHMGFSFLFERLISVFIFEVAPCALFLLDRCAELVRFWLLKLGFGIL